MMTLSKWSLGLLTITLTAFLGAQTVDAQTAGGATRPTMTAKLIDPDKKAAEHAATVEVTTSGVQLVDPAIANEKPIPGQGHLHYQVDNGPIVATPSAKLSFHELAPGAHTIRVVLAGNDHKPLGAQQQLTVTIPKGMMSTAGQPTDPAPQPTATSSKPTDPAPAPAPAKKTY